MASTHRRRELSSRPFAALAARLQVPAPDPLREQLDANPAGVWLAPTGPLGGRPRSERPC